MYFRRWKKTGSRFPTKVCAHKLHLICVILMYLTGWVRSLSGPISQWVINTWPQAMDKRPLPTTDHQPDMVTWLTGFVQYERSVRGAKPSANTVSTRILAILIMSLILLMVHYSRVWEFEIFVLRVNILFRVEFDGEAESEVKLRF